MGGQPCCEKIGLKRGPWTWEEDQKLMNFILNNGIQCWRLVPELAGSTAFSFGQMDIDEELSDVGDQLKIAHVYFKGNMKVDLPLFEPGVAQDVGNRGGRRYNEIKNHWNTRIKKKMKLLGLDPLTHKRIEPASDSESKENQHGLEVQEIVSSSKDGQMWQKAEDDESCIKNLMMGGSVVVQNTESLGIG
ncbi:transcription factor MYB20-like [Primulina huaijiensis]|uniref:transcription factor MYB20-like n=1 Tax=Primulina huaijiensis TaxID=1492673 RepID=UPI003CC70718